MDVLLVGSGPRWRHWKADTGTTAPLLRLYRLGVPPASNAKPRRWTEDHKSEGLQSFAQHCYTEVRNAFFPGKARQVDAAGCEYLDSFVAFRNHGLCTGKPHTGDICRRFGSPDRGQ